jgi:hypothetical protein
MEEAKVQQAAEKLDRLRAAATKDYSSFAIVLRMFHIGTTDYEKYRSRVLTALGEGLKAAQAEMHAGRYEVAACYGYAARRALTILEKHVFLSDMVVRQMQVST